MARDSGGESDNNTGSEPQRAISITVETDGLLKAIGELFEATEKPNTQSDTQKPSPAPGTNPTYPPN